MTERKQTHHIFATEISYGRRVPVRTCDAACKLVSSIVAKLVHGPHAVIEFGLAATVVLDLTWVLAELKEVAVLRICQHTKSVPTSL